MQSWKRAFMGLLRELGLTMRYTLWSLLESND